MLATASTSPSTAEPSILCVAWLRQDTQHGGERGRKRQRGRAPLQFCKGSGARAVIRRRERRWVSRAAASATQLCGFGGGCAAGGTTAIATQPRRPRSPARQR